jgi:hypothetical protein
MRRSVPFMVLAAVLTACGGGTTSPTSITGNYVLRTVNGNNLPASVGMTAVERYELLSGNFNLKADNTWSGALAQRTTTLATGAVVTLSSPFNGTYAENNGSITLTDASDQYPGTVGGGTLTVSATARTGGTFTLVFTQ